MARDIVSTCIDERMPLTLPEILERTGVDRYHPAHAFGCSLGLDHEFGLYQKIIDGLHPHRANIYDHLDCKAFRFKFGETTREEEIKWHIEKLNTRKQQLQELFPSLEIRLFLLPDVTPDRIAPIIQRVTPEGLIELVAA